MDTRHGAPSSVPAARFRRPGLRDARFLAGVMLVAASVALGSLVVSAVARTVPVYVAASPLVAGERVDAAQLAVREVRLAESLDLYLRADQDLADDLVAVRDVRAGEVIPRSALAVAADLALRPVAITPAGALPAGVVEGAAVDLWFVPDQARGLAGTGTGTPDPPAPPQLLAEALTVAEVSEPRGGFSVGSSSTVHVMVPVEALPGVLGALAAPGTVEVVLVPGTGS